ncbi:unnamed protein product [Cyclocybe aegerita]|uniref:Uncharacterized protein n=1 Tax=Cyclocybe aegerita TaxID=1973307 RepID=A0A8S0VR28_CYCAE|nr:unnamed protein product [Cyclocybe aegerita]
MTSRLETVPRDVLQHIALQCAASAFEPPVEILRLMLTRSTLYHSLNTVAAPHLYAQIFVAKFDTSAPFRQYRSTMTDSALTAELTSRCRLLRRVRHMDFSSVGLLQDLWTALWMVLESDGLNETHLSKCHFTDFILGIAHIWLRSTVPPTGADQTSDAKPLRETIVWLLSENLPRSMILEMSKQDRDDLYSLIFPYIFSPNKKPESPALRALSYPGPSIPINVRSENAHVYTYLRRQLPYLPDPSLAAINLAYAIFEATPLKIPPHLPETRTTANASQRLGPTKEDYRNLGSYRTLLFSDSMAMSVGNGLPGEETSPGILRSMLHDIEFGNVLSQPAAKGPSTASGVFAYKPGTMTGLWEGTYRTVPFPASASQGIETRTVASMVIVKPLQCALTEFICEETPSLEDDVLNTNICPTDYFDVRDVSELCLNGRKFRKFGPQWSTTLPQDPEPDKLLHDVLLLGETLVDHDQAWGAFRFSGQIHRDGRVVLKREPTDSGEWQGVWIFEGHLRFGKVVLGRWRITGAHGVFSLGKTHEKWKG